LYDEAELLLSTFGAATLFKRWECFIHVYPLILGWGYTMYSLD